MATTAQLSSSPRGISQGSRLSVVPEDPDLSSYDWPNLPPVHLLRDAMCRQRISSGISYILPVDKTRNSVNNEYRTNLSLMFKEPYLNDNPHEYDDQAVIEKTKYHFVPNKAPTPLKPNKSAGYPLKYFKLNAESAKAHANFRHSAPSQGADRGGEQGEELRQRSSLFLPIKAIIPPEAARLKAEAEKIINSVQDEQEKNFDAAANATIPTSPEKMSYRPRRTTRAQLTLPDSFFSDGKLGGRRQSKQDTPKPRSVGFARKDEPQTDLLFKKAGMFNSYESLKKMPLPDRRKPPPEIFSPYLSEEKTSDIWQWLHKDEALTDFNFFLQVCS